MKNSQKSAMNGLKWSAIERLLTQGIQFCLMIVIARMLSPEDFGLIGMLTIFIAVAQTFIDSGFYSALLRKGQPTETEYCTAFYFNVIIGFICYLIIYATSHYIAKFYQQPELSMLAKVLGVNVFISSIAIVQRAKLTIALNFKEQTKASLLSVLISGAVGITLAYRGNGVWALATQAVIMNLVNTIMLWFLGGWRPKARFNWSVFKDMFDYGSKLLASGILDAIYKNIYILIIGKQFSALQLGYYTQAQKLTEVPATNITAIIQRVNFPLMSKIKNDDKSLKNSYLRDISLSAFVMFPLMGGLAVMAEPCIQLVLGDKWLPSAPLMAVLCFVYMLFPLHSINLNLLQVKGRSDLFLKLEIAKKLLITFALFITVPYGVYTMCIGMLVTSCISLVMNSYFSCKFLKVSFMTQFKILAPILLNVAIASIISNLSMNLIHNNVIQLIVASLTGLACYITGAKFLSPNELYKVIVKLNPRYIKEK